MKPGGSRRPLEAAFAVTLAAALVQPMTGSLTARAQTPAELDCGLQPGPTRAVAAVLDGDTIRLDDGVEVRLVGALAPRARDVGASPKPPSTWPPAASATTELTRLLQGRSVQLAFSGRRDDRYGRVLAQVFVVHGGATQWVQGRLAEGGLARVYALPETGSCSAQLLARERVARAAKRGLWANAAYQVRHADKAGEIALYRHTFQLVRGRVARVRGSRGLAVLELGATEADARPPAGRRHARGFRVIWRRVTGRKIGLDPARNYAGRTVLVRGWIGGRRGRGPEIEIIAEGQIEVE